MAIDQNFICGWKFCYLVFKKSYSTLGIEQKSSIRCLGMQVCGACQVLYYMHILQSLHVPDRPYDISEKIKVMDDYSPVVSFEADPVF